MLATANFLPLVDLTVLAREVEKMGVKKLAEAIGGGRSAPPFCLGCLFFAACLAVRWSVSSQTRCKELPNIDM